MLQSKCDHRNKDQTPWAKSLWMACLLTFFAFQGDFSFAASKKYENCGPIILDAFVARVQNFDRTAATEGERLTTKCPNESYDALQWTSFLFAISGERDRARTIDRLWIKPPTRKTKAVERTIQLARAGSPQLLREKLMNFDSAYIKDPRNRWTLGRALARAGEIDAARREYYTYLAARPNDEVAEIEYLYLNIWAGNGVLALSNFRAAMETHTSKDFLAAMERGIKLVFILWPDLAPKENQPLASNLVPTPTPVASATVVIASPVPIESKPVVAVPSALEPKNNETTRGMALVSFENDQVVDYFSMSQVKIKTEGLAVNPELYGLRSKFTALNEPSNDAAGLGVHRQWQLHESIEAGGGVGWFSSPVGGFATGRFYFSAQVPLDLQLGAVVSRKPLALDVPLVKQDLRVARDAIEAQLSWKQIVSWRGAMEWEGTGLPHERHDGLLRWGFAGDCSSQQCLDFFVPILWERYQTLSPYYYNDDERIGYGPGVMGRLDIAQEFYVKSSGKLVAWQALPPGGDIENYTTSELSVEFGWRHRSHQVSFAYDWRRTSSERLFRRYEVPTSLVIHAGMGL